jgi:putative oxidoreductase
MSIYYKKEITVVSTSSNDSPVSGRGRIITLWILSGLAAVAFVAAGGAKLAGAPAMIAVFEKVGVGQWFRYVTGLLEVAGAIGLLIPRYAFYAALLLAMVMTGAVIAHLTVLGGSPAAPVILLILTGTVAWLRKQQSNGALTGPGYRRR